MPNGSTERIIFTAHRVRVRDLITEHVAEHYQRLPAEPRLSALVPWLRDCQWNARAVLYEYFVTEIQEQCAERANEPCTRTQACEHLAGIVGTSARTVARYIRQREVPDIAAPGARRIGSASRK